MILCQRGAEIMRSNLFWLNDEQWRRIEPHLPTDVRGKDRVDDRRVISGILHVLKSGCRWCDCPPQYGPHIKAHRSASGGKGGSKNRRLDARAAGAIRRSTQSQMLKAVFFPSF